MTSPLPPLSFADLPIPARAGIGLKFEHIQEVKESTPNVGWFEIHAENFMSSGGPSLKVLEDIRSNYPLSVHGVGLSLGGAEPLNQLHLQRLYVYMYLPLESRLISTRSPKLNLLLDSQSVFCCKSSEIAHGHKS